MRLVRIGVMLLILGLALAVGQPAEAQAKTLVWESYDVTLTVFPNGDLRVLERQRIRFTSGTFTFGFAVIPLDKIERITDVGVSEPGVGSYAAGGFSSDPFTFDASVSEGELEIRWYYPETTNAVRTFDLTYTAQGAVRVYDSGDKLQWIAIDSERDFPVQSASVTVVLPPGASFQIIDSYGVPANWGQSADGSSVTYLATGGLSAYDTFEIGVEFTHGAIPDAKPAWQVEHDLAEGYQLNVKPFVDLAIGGFSALLILGGPALVFVLWYTRGRDPQIGAVPEYVTDPPDNLPPGVLGTLIDERADMQDIVATVIDLAHKGYLSIEETGRTGLLGLGTEDFIFRKTKDSAAELGPVEREVLNGIFTGGKSERKLSDLRNKFYTQLPKIQSRLYEEMQSRKFFRTNPDKTRKIWRGVGFALLFGSIFLGAMASASLSQFSSMVPCLFGGFGLLGLTAVIAGGYMPAKTRLGAEAAARWSAFKNYLLRIDSLADLKQSGAIFERYLPYAIAFGIRDSWIHRFAQIDTTPIPVWYMPYGWSRGGPVRAGGSRGGGLGRVSGPSGGLQGMSDSLAGGLQSMSDGLTRMLNSTSRVMRSAPSSSGSSRGGFSSGGFSGGGGGGGGGRGFG